MLSRVEKAEAEATNHKPRSAHIRLVSSVPYTEGALGGVTIHERAAPYTQHAALFHHAALFLFLLLCWALSTAHYFVPYGNQQLDLTWLGRWFVG